MDLKKYLCSLSHGELHVNDAKVFFQKYWNINLYRTLTLGKFAQLIWSIGLRKVQSVMLQHVWILFPCAWTVDIKTVQQP